MGGLFSGASSRRAGAWAYMEAQKAREASQAMLDQGRIDALGSITEGRTQGLGALDAGYAAARPEYEAAIGRFDPYTQAGTKALGTYQDSLGLNGAGGNANAVSQFQAGPGYQWQQDQAADQIARKQSSLGSLGSGNTMVALQDRAQNIANQEYGNWQGQLKGLSDTGLQSTGAQATLQKGLGDLGVSEGRDVANLWGTTGAQNASIYTNAANAGAQNTWTGQQTGTNALLGGIKNGQDQVASGMNLALGLGGAGLNLLGLGMGGGKTLGGSLFSSLGR